MAPAATAAGVWVWQAGYFNDTDRQFHDLFSRHLDDLVPAFLAGREPPVHARAGRRALLLALAVIRSHETGGRVRVPAADGAAPPEVG